MTRLVVAALVAAAGCACEDRVPSPSGDRFAHYTSCSGQSTCGFPEVVITRRDGAEVRRFNVPIGQTLCGSILDVQWAGEQAVGVECHENPSMSYYVEVEIASGKVLRRYEGYDFVRSPDYSRVAHVGWIPHFALPWMKSAYLDIGNTIVYPLPRGMKPVEANPPQKPPEVVTERGLVYSGVHDFYGKFVWSPDSRKVGLIDCLVDYRLRDNSQEAFEEGGTPENMRCFAVAVALDGTFRSARIAPEPRQEFGLQWTSAQTLVVTHAGQRIEIQMR